MRTGDFTRTVAGEVAMFRRLQDFAVGNHSPSASTKGDPLSPMNMNVRIRSGQPQQRDSFRLALYVRYSRGASH